MSTQDIYKLCIELEGEKYAVAVVGYLSDGSYFLKDLSQKKGVYNIIKMKIDSSQMQTFGMHSIPFEETKQWITTHKPKLSHHISGEVQVSGTGIISGNFKALKKPKGVQVFGPHFTDGGPMGLFTFWGLDGFQKISNTSEINNIVFSTNEIIDLHPKLYDKNCAMEAFTFELFYMDKMIKEVVNKHGSVSMNHPQFGVVTLKTLDHDTANPAIFAVMCRKSKVGWNSEHGFVYGTGSTALDKKGFFEQIQITYPFTDDYKKFLNVSEKVKIKNLDFNPRFRAWCLVDDWANKFLNK